MKQDFTESFINHLTRLVERDRGAAATLRRSLAFQPGTWPPAFPFVEQWVQGIQHTEDDRRRSAYLIAGLIAQHGTQASSISFASAFGHFHATRQSPSIERRFINLLDADEQQLPYHLRQAVMLIDGDEHRFDYRKLYQDITHWSHPDRFVQQQWARDFYSKQIIQPQSTEQGEAA